MNTIKIKTLLICFVSTITISLLSSPANASYKQWPLQSKGEVRYLKVIKVYDIGLYSPTSVNAKNVLNTNISKCLKIDYAVALSVDKFRLATKKVLNRQHTAEYLKTIQQPLEALQMAYKPVKKGDTYHLCYNGKNKNMRLELNDTKLIEIQSAELAKAYLGIWLSNNKPISGPLYKTLFAKNK